MSTPLVDAEGFPRADIDIWAVRHARVRVIELQNYISAIVERIKGALQDVAGEVASAIAAPTTDGVLNVIGITTGVNGGYELRPLGKVKWVANSGTLEDDQQSVHPREGDKALSDVIRCKKSLRSRVQVCKTPHWLALNDVAATSHEYIRAEGCNFLSFLSFLLSTSLTFSGHLHTNNRLSTVFLPQCGRISGLFGDFFDTPRPSSRGPNQDDLASPDRHRQRLSNGGIASSGGFCRWRPT